MANTTNTSTLPREVQERYEIVGELEGGPRYDLPNFGFIGLDFSKLTLEQAALLVRRRWKYIRTKTPAASSKSTAPASPEQ